jgi:hypothetical protein
MRCSIGSGEPILLENRLMCSSGSREKTFEIELTRFHTYNVGEADEKMEHVHNLDFAILSSDPMLFNFSYKLSEFRREGLAVVFDPYGLVGWMVDGRFVIHADVHKGERIQLPLEFENFFHRVLFLSVFK